MAAGQLCFMAARERTRGAAAISKRGWQNCWGPALPGPADNALQIDGGNGFALEFEISRILCDARILNIFEGAAEIQAQVIARRILEGGNWEAEACIRYRHSPRLLAQSENENAKKFERLNHGWMLLPTLPEPGVSTSGTTVEMSLSITWLTEPMKKREGQTYFFKLSSLAA